MWSSADSFLSALWSRGVSSISYRLTGEFWINFTAWGFYSLYRLLIKCKRKLSFLVVGKGKFFIMKLFFEEFNLFSSRWSACPVCFEMQPRQRRFGEFWGFYSMVKEITFLKGNLCIYKCFIDILFILASVFKEKLQNVPRLAWFCVEFCSVLSRFLLA